MTGSGVRGWEAEVTAGWTEERVTTLKELWLKGLSASQIAKQLGGTTRKAVVGKVHRLNLTGGQVAGRSPSEASAHHSAPQRMQARLEAKAFKDPTFREDEQGAVTILSLEAHMCKWPIGDPSSDQFSYCGATRDGVDPYCKRHKAVAYSGVAKDKEDLARSLRRYL